MVCGVDACLTSTVSQQSRENFTLPSVIPSTTCPRGQLCHPVLESDCLTPPCEPWGVCLPVSDINRGLLKDHPHCTTTEGGCVILMITFALRKLPLVRPFGMNKIEDIH